MDSHDFAKLQGLLSKLTLATGKAANTDGSFKKYHTRSMELLKEFPNHLKQLEQGLRTARIIE